MVLMQDIVNGILIATGRGGEFKNTPWVTLVINIAKDDIMDLEYYFNEEEAKIGHENMIAYFSDKYFAERIWHGKYD